MFYAWGYNDVGELGSSAFDYSWPYPGPNAEDPQMATEIPQRVGLLRDVPWLATGSGAFRQVALRTPAAGRQCHVEAQLLHPAGRNAQQGAGPGVQGGR